MPGIFKTVNPAVSVGNNRRTRTSLSVQFLFKCRNSLFQFRPKRIKCPGSLFFAVFRQSKLQFLLSVNNSVAYRRAEAGGLSKLS